MLSCSAASRWCSKRSLACARSADECATKRSTDCVAARRPWASSRAPVAVSTTRSKVTPLSRRPASACSSAAAERGASQRPKARKAARSSGAPSPPAGRPRLRAAHRRDSHTTKRWSRVLLSASLRCSGAAHDRRRGRADSTFSAAVRARSRISQIADRIAAPMMPTKTASWITSEAPKSAAAAAGSCARAIAGNAAPAERQATMPPLRPQGAGRAADGRARLVRRPNRTGCRRRRFPPRAGSSLACLVPLRRLNAKTALTAPAFPRRRARESLQSTVLTNQREEVVATK